MMVVNEAQLIITEFVKLVPGERVCLVTDFARRNEAQALLLACQHAGADVIVIDASPTISKWMSSGAYWLDLPPHLHVAVQAANVSIFTVDETYAFRLDHHVRRLFKTGPDCSVFKVDVGMGKWGINIEDIQRTNVIGHALMNAVDGHDRVHVTSPNGTDITVSIRDRKCLPVWPLPERGMPYGIPVPLWGEYNWAPLEDSAEGIFVIDGISEATALLHTVSAPVTLKVHAGRVVEVLGWRDADDWRSIFRTDVNANVVGELGIGANSKAWPGTETEKALLGTVHIGFGDNSDYPGGTNSSQIHVDGVSRDVTIEVDGRIIVKDGRLAMPIASEGSSATTEG